VAESFIASLKTELLYGRSWLTKESVRVAVFEYIETFYNSRRRHSTLGHLSPMEYEEVRIREEAVA
jgi:putative transposase